MATTPPAGDDRSHPTRASGRATREALMEAALAHIEAQGVLAGLNLREVADSVGVTTPNIYHHFGSRQALLRAAIAHRVASLDVPIGIAVTGSFVEWRTAIFDLVLANPSLRATALLALDDDPDYQPLELWDLAQEHYRRLVDEGELPEDLDTVAAHVLTLSMAMGLSIYGPAVSRQLGLDQEELVRRSRQLFVTMLERLVPPSG